MYAGVSIARRKGDKYEKPEAIEVENDYNYSSKVDYFLAPSGNAMIISAERDDSYGRRDLYVSFKDGRTWSEPLNLGNEVNTASDDYSPFLGEDSKTLYYSTSGFSGYGGSDIYVTIRLDNTWENWSVPENLGNSLNSPGDDQYFSIPSSGKHIYFSRGKSDEDTDIFRFKADELFVDKESPLIASMDHLLTKDPDDFFATVTGKVIEAATGNPLAGAAVIMERLPDGIDVGAQTSDKDGNFELTVRAGARYGLLAELDGYISTDENFDFNDLAANDTLSVDLKLSKIEAGASIVLNNIFFDFDKAVLKTSSYPELNRILVYMKDGTIGKIKITGHTDSVGDEDYNLRLSQRRAKAVLNFFRENGIPSDRISSEGYGETRPKAPNDTKENRSKNRRVEFEITE